MTAPKTVRLDVLARELGAELHGPGDLEVTGLGTLGAAGPGQLTFLANPRYRAHLENSRAGAVLLRADQLEAMRLKKYKEAEEIQREVLAAAERVPPASQE